MLKFKSKKGEVATLLTLGLVLIGSLVTIGISFLTNNNKIASNPRAVSGCQVIGPGQSCCFTQDGGDTTRVYSTYEAMCANEMNMDCSAQTGVVSSYNADGPAFACDGSSPIEGNGCGVAICDGGSVGAVPPGGGGVLPEGCTNTTCKAENFGQSSDPISYYENKPDIFYFQLNCGGNKHTDTEIQNDEYCGNTSGACNEIQCKQWKAQLKQLSGYDEDFMNNNIVWKKLGSDQLYTDYPCDDDLETDYQTACIPSAAVTCDSVSCSVATGNNSVDFGDKEVSQLSDKPGVYYKSNSDCEDKASTDLKVECPLPPPASQSSWNVVGPSVDHGDVTYVNCLAEKCGELMSIFQNKCKNMNGRYVIVSNTGCTGRYCCDPNVP